MVFLRIRPGSRSSRSPSCTWNNCILSSKNVKTLKQGSSAEFSCFTPRDCKRPQWNKPFLNTSIFPRCIESRCTEKNQARSLMTSTHASVRCSILVFTDIQTPAEESLRLATSSRAVESGLRRRPSTCNFLRDRENLRGSSSSSFNLFTIEA